MELANQNIRTQLLEMLSAFNALSRPLLLETQCRGYRTHWDSIATAVNSGLRGRVKQGEFGPTAFIEEIYWLKRLLIVELVFTEQDPPTIPLSHRIGMYLYNEQEFDALFVLAKAFEYVYDLVDAAMDANGCCDLCSSNWPVIQSSAIEAEKVLRYFDTISLKDR